MHLFQWTTELCISETERHHRKREAYENLAYLLGHQGELGFKQAYSAKKKIINVVKKIFEHFSMATNIAEQVLKYTQNVGVGGILVGFTSLLFPLTCCVI